MNEKERYWYGLSVPYAREHEACERLEAFGAEVFLPMHSADRRFGTASFRKVSRPRFPGLLFFRTAEVPSETVRQLLGPSFRLLTDGKTQQPVRFADGLLADPVRLIRQLETCSDRSGISSEATDAIFLKLSIESES